MIDTLAQEYVAAMQEVDERIEEMKAENRGLIDSVMGFINGVIDTINKLVEMITNLFAAIKSVIGVIIQDPIGFMGNLFDGIGKGIDAFKANIQTHLLSGLLEWLTGSLGPIGIVMPKDIFSLSGIFNLVLQVLGLGWDYIRLKAVKMMGEPVVKALEGGYDMFKTFATKGVDGIWEFLKDKFSDLKEVVIDAIKDMLITQVIQAGIKWLLSLLIPGAGFIKAIMAIKDLIVFFVESAMMLIPAITEAILALAAGSIAGVAKAIEFGLAKLIGLVINLFAKLIGLGGLSKKVQAIFKKIRKRVDKAVGKLLKKARKAGRKLMGKLGIGTKEKPKNKEQHDQQVKAGMLYLHQQEKALDKDGNRSLTPEEANKVAAKTKKKFAVFTSITPKIVGGKWVYHWTGSQGDEDGLKASLESGDLHDSVISYSPGSFNGATMGTDTNASILTKKGPSGTEPTKAKHAIFDDLLFRRDGGRSYYVRGHLLNQKLHGSGKWENMTPLSQKGNQDHERDAESKVKKAVDAGKTVEYTIKPVYGRGKLETPEDADPKLKEIRDAEQYVPTGVTVFAQVISLEDGKIKRVNFKSDYFESN